jgi:hypothetical protein
MEYRKEINHFWEEEGIDPEENTPAILLHTLLEMNYTACHSKDVSNLSWYLNRIVLISAILSGLAGIR